MGAPLALMKEDVNILLKAILSVQRKMAFLSGDPEVFIATS